MTAIRAEVRQLETSLQRGPAPAPPRPDPAYAASARAMLRERSAPWAGMLRAVESASRLGVTPVRVEFEGASAVARVEVAYADAPALLDYVDRLNAGLEPGREAGAWRIVQLRQGAAAATTPAVLSPARPGPGMAAPSIATLQSTWHTE